MQQDATQAPESDDDEVLCTGLGASPGTNTGIARVLDGHGDVDRVDEGDVIVTEMTMPEMVPAMKRAAGIVTDEGGITSHAAIVSRELGVPAVVGSGNATSAIENGEYIAVDGERGRITPATESAETTTETETTTTPERPSAPATTSTGVKVNVSIPEAAERAAATGADGVGLLRCEHIILGMQKTPRKYVNDHGEEAFVEAMAEEVIKVADPFYPRPVQARTLDAPTDELAELEGGSEEPHEHNPMLGWRGVRRSLDEPELTKLELRAFKRVYEQGYDNLRVMFPLPNDPSDVAEARELMREVGISPDDRTWGAMIETPASVRQIDAIIETGIDFVALGTNDLVQYILAVDRNNGQVADRFDELHPSVLDAVSEVIEACNEHGVETTITGQAGSKPEMARFLVQEGISSVSANIDAVDTVREVIDRAEREMLLEFARERLASR